MSDPSRRPRVLLVFNSLRTGGSQTYAVALTRLLVGAGTDVHVIAKPGATQHLFEEAGASVQTVQWREGSARDGLGLRNIAATALSLARFAATLATIRAGRFDLVLASQPWPMFYAAALIRGTPVVALVHGKTEVEFPPAYERFTLSRMTSILCVSRETAAEISRFGVADRLQVVGNLFDAKTYWNSEKPWETSSVPDEKAVVSVSTLTSNKSDVVLRLIDAMKDRSEWRLTIVGDGPERASLEARVQFLGIAGRVVFAGAMTDVRPQYRSAQVVVGVGRVALEAASGGTPVVIASDGKVFGHLTADKLEAAEEHNFTGRASGSLPLSEPTLVSAIDEALASPSEARRELARRLTRVGRADTILRLVRRASA